MKKLLIVSALVVSGIAIAAGNTPAPLKNQPIFFGGAQVLKASSVLVLTDKNEAFYVTDVAIPASAVDWSKVTYKLCPEPVVDTANLFGPPIGTNKSEFSPLVVDECVKVWQDLLANSPKSTSDSAKLSGQLSGQVANPQATADQSKLAGMNGVK